MKKNLFCIIVFFSIFLNVCDKNISNSSDNGSNNEKVNPIEPEMILINENLEFTFLIYTGFFSYAVDTVGLITFEPYCIGKYEVTNLEYYQFVIDSGYSDSINWSDEGWQIKTDLKWKAPKYWDYDSRQYNSDPYSNEDNTPVHGISFYEAEAYCNWLSIKTGINYSLPTEEQWQRAAKGPDPGFLYPWGNNWEEEKANYLFCNDNILLPVNVFPEGKSIEGCYNMIGNVYEFTRSFKKGAVIYFSYYHPGEYDLNEIKLSMTSFRRGICLKYGRYLGHGMRLVY